MNTSQSSSKSNSASTRSGTPPSTQTPMSTLIQPPHHIQTVAPTHVPVPTPINQQQSPDHPIRARHTIRLSSLRHNFDVVSAAANKQKCSVITVVKADGYGHGAIQTALHLADYCGADAFAVATLEEGIALRKAFMDTSHKSHHNLNYSHHAQHNQAATSRRNSRNPSPSTEYKTATGTAIAIAKKKTVPITSTSLFTPPTSAIEVQSHYSELSSIGAPVPVGVSATATHHHNMNTPISVPKPPPMNTIRSNHIRIIVLGPPTDIPNDFNRYNHYNIEVMISSTKMARALMEWVADCDSRKIAEVDQAAADRKIELVATKNEEKDKSLLLMRNALMMNNGNGYGQRDGNVMGGQAATLSQMEGVGLGQEVRAILNKAKDAAVAAASAGMVTQQDCVPSNTTNSAVSGATVGVGVNSSIHHPLNESCSVVSGITTSTAITTNQNLPRPITQSYMTDSSLLNSSIVTTTPMPFKGIEDVAKVSRIRELAAAKVMAHVTGEGDDDDDDNGDDSETNEMNNIVNHDDENDVQTADFESHSNASRTSTTSTSSLLGNIVLNENELDDGKVVSTVSSAVAKTAIAAATSNGVPMKSRKKIRWHALIDSGMGRLGFKSVEDNNDLDEEEKPQQDKITYGCINGGEKKVKKWKVGPHKDTVSVIKAMTDAEIDGAPIEFYGMCTHMAEASSNSSYTNEQMARFKSLLNQVRQAGMTVPTVSTDNSAALLTTNLTHFDPDELLSQPNVATRGFVRTGGAVYGQRPAFPQLRAVSTVSALVRHVADMEKGQSVGYDRAYLAEKNVRIATLSIGFADGYPRELGNGRGKVAIRGELFPVAGNVCMDMLMIDLGCVDSLTEATKQVSIGDTAYLWGPANDDECEGLVRLQDVANTLKTTQSALTCGLDKARVQRLYI